ncbi:MAG TPA: hypothetical protein VNO43_01870 [Candidatus Eisenbacteria bacterium]|nr:hypothetical protein [Candidatus Eisenbacteria bacterium]
MKATSYIADFDSAAAMLGQLSNYLRGRSALVPVERWRRILERARKKGVFLGVDESAFPRDFAVFVRYRFDLQRTIQARYSIPAPLSLDDLDRFLAERGARYNVQWSTA